MQRQYGICRYRLIASFYRILPYSGVWWWAELGLLIVCEAFSMAVYIVGSVAMVEVVPTRFEI